MKLLTNLIFLCMAIYANGLIQSSFADNTTVRCGSLICRPISEIFRKSLLSHGYVPITTIPAGASNISIIEMKNSMNLLVLKTVDGEYLINGKQGASLTGSYENYGSIFEYKRVDEPKHTSGKSGITEWISSPGVLAKPIELLILVKDINPGIKYSYYMPIAPNLTDEDYKDNTENHLAEHKIPEIPIIDNKLNNVQPTPIINRPIIEKRKRKFMWKIIGFGPCSKTCGGGYQAPVYRCIRETQTRFYPARRCMSLEKPTLNEDIYRCNSQPCPAYWHIDKWNDCLCRNGKGIQDRQIRCVQELTTGVVVQVNHILCLNEKPDDIQQCDCPKQIKKNNNNFKYDKNRLLTNFQGVEQLTNSTEKILNGYTKNKNGVWLTSEWNQHCSTECGNGFEYRSIFCDRTPPYTDRCDLRITPDTARSCESDRNCKNGEWFTGRWGSCGGDCFNLVRRREVYCIRNNVVVEDEECHQHRKPEISKNCTLDEVKYCKARWHYSEWTVCTRSCSGGTQQRSAKCLELDPKENVLRESQNCKYGERQPVYSVCNTHKCPELTIDPHVDLIQNDLMPTCVDELAHCHQVVKARLCGLEFYQRNCCLSCSG